MTDGVPVEWSQGTVPPEVSAPEVIPGVLGPVWGLGIPTGAVVRGVVVLVGRHIQSTRLPVRPDHTPLLLGRKEKIGKGPECGGLGTQKRFRLSTT